mgnify:CR=1 FL=1
MTKVYLDTIERMDCYPTFETKTDVVFNIYWRMNETDGDYFASACGVCSATWAEGDPFTAYEDLTFEQVWGWVAEKIDIQAMKDSLDKQIEDQKNPPVVTLPLPWPLTPTLPTE